MHTADKQKALESLVNNPLDRREFARRVMATGAAAAGLCALTGTEAWAQSQSDVDIVNFALNLEYLEAEFYTVATSGRRIADLGIGVTGVGNQGATTGGGVVALEERVRVVAEQIALDEQAHVRVLRTALCSLAIAKPAIDLEALGIGFRNQNEFITLARAFEDVGVTAYAGAAPLIQNRAILGTAAQIALTEGQHAGVLRYFAYERGLQVPRLDGIDVPPQSMAGGRVFNVDSQGLSPTRTPAQVLRIVFAAPNGGARSGGFFPVGVNGPIDFAA